MLDVRQLFPESSALGLRRPCGRPTKSARLAINRVAAGRAARWSPAALCDRASAYRNVTVQRANTLYRAHLADLAQRTTANQQTPPAFAPPLSVDLTRRLRVKTKPPQLAGSVLGAPVLVSTTAATTPAITTTPALAPRRLRPSSRRRCKGPWVQRARGGIWRSAPCLRASASRRTLLS